MCSTMMARIMTADHLRLGKARRDSQAAAQSARGCTVIAFCNRSMSVRSGSAHRIHSPVQRVDDHAGLGRVEHAVQLPAQARQTSRKPQEDVPNPS